MESSSNVMAHSDAREGKWRGNWRMEWVARTLHTTSEYGSSSITTTNAHTSAASSRPNWCPPWFKWTRPFRRKMKSGFCACAVTFQTQAACCTVRCLYAAVTQQCLLHVIIWFLKLLVTQHVSFTGINIIMSISMATGTEAQSHTQPAPTMKSISPLQFNLFLESWCAKFQLLSRPHTFWNYFLTMNAALWNINTFSSKTILWFLQRQHTVFYALFFS